MFGDKIKILRETKGLLQRQLAAELEIDTPMYSKIERGERRAKKEQVLLLVDLLGTTENDLLSIWLADQIYDLVKNEEFRLESLKIVEKRLTENRMP
ncbi:MAG TPA: helix-turn-helix transcriptional regulator [Flavipsychrobacter sp.]|nr:helix-turn-helix transcriptional regulator [Flavipsychrobacter sp.]